MQTEIDILLAKQAITEQIYVYCRAMDRIDNALGASIWHPDGTADYGPLFQGSGAAFVEFVAAAHRNMLGHSHQVTNILISVHGEFAASEAYVTVALRFEDNGRLLQCTNRGRYLDRWSRRNGRWAIDKRHYVHDFDDVQEISDPGITGWGARDGSDPSYRVFEF